MNSAKEIETSGQSLAAIQQLQQKLLEEAYLHMFEMQKEIDELKSAQSK